MSNQQLPFVRQLHLQYICNLDKMERDSFEYQATEHLRMNGMYWALTALDLFIKTEEEESFKMDKEKVIEFVLSCQHDNGGFSGNVDHDPHLLYTLSAIQVLVLYRALDRIDKMKVANYIASLQKSDGSFMGDEWGEVDTRFSYCALNCLKLLGCSLAETLPFFDKTVEFILHCRNFDGGFGAIPGAESHAGQIFCCVGALAILNSLDKIDQDTLSWWLCERQVEENGGLNGRPEKLSDVCYSWWVLSSLAMMDRVHWIHKDKLKDFILNCQDLENGGISDKPNNMVDIFHTFFGIAGLSLLREPLKLKTIDPMYALPVDALRYCNIDTPTTKRYLV